MIPRYYLLPLILLFTGTTAYMGHFYKSSLVVADILWWLGVGWILSWTLGLGTGFGVERWVLSRCYWMWLRQSLFVAVVFSMVAPLYFGLMIPIAEEITAFFRRESGTYEDAMNEYFFYPDQSGMAWGSGLRGLVQGLLGAALFSAQALPFILVFTGLLVLIQIGWNRFRKGLPEKP